MTMGYALPYALSQSVYRLQIILALACGDRVNEQIS